MSLCLGIVLHEALGALGMDHAGAFVVLVGLVAVEVLLFYLLKSYRYRWIFGVATILVFVYLGYFRACLQDATRKDNHYSHVIMGDGYYLARVNDPPSEKDKSVKVVLDLCGLVTENE